MSDGSLKSLLERYWRENKPIYNGSGISRAELLLAIAIGAVGVVIIAMILI